MRTLIPASLLLAALLSACGGTGGVLPPSPVTVPPPVTVTPPVTPPVTPSPVEPMFIPVAGAAVGTGSGTKLGTVYVSPTAEEVEVMRLVNEVRTKGTLNGQDATVGSCVEGTFKADTLRPLTYNGLYAYAARKHAIYMSEVGYEGHIESQTTSPYFYGATNQDRVVRAYKEQAGLTDTPQVGENLVTGNTRATPETAMRAWMTSPGHCRNIMYPVYRMSGIGHYVAAEVPQANRWGHSWSMVLGY